jgi:hypothetical protein
VKVGAGGGGTIGGSGTTNRVPKFTASTTIGNSSIVDSASAVTMTINPSGNIGVGTTNAPNKFVVSNAGLSGFEVAPTGGVSSGVLLQAYNRNTLAYMAQSYYALGHTWNVGTAAATRAMDIASGGAVLINTTTDNGVDKLQVSGGMNVSARATVQNLSVTNNISVTNDVNQGSGTANANYTILANGTSSGWAGRMVGDYATGGFVFQHRNNSPTFVNCWALNANSGVGQTYFYDRVFVTNNPGNGAVLVVNSTTDNGVDKLQVAGSIYSSTTLKGNDISIVGTGSIPTLTSTQFTTQSFSALTTAKTANYTTAFNDYFIDCTSGTFTVTLQAAASYQGRVLIIKNSGAGTITVDGNGAETIDGATTYSLSVQYATVQIMSDGTNWKIIAKF